MVSPHETIIRNGLPPVLVDDPLFRKVLVTTSRMGQTTVCIAKHSSGKLFRRPLFSESTCEHYWSIEGWIHSQRRNRLDQKLVEKLVRVHINLVLRESLVDTLRDLLPWDIEFVIDEPVDEKEEEPEA
jgi:hypothetical protein